VNDLEKFEERRVTTVSNQDAVTLVEMAMQKGYEPEFISKMMDLQERNDSKIAKQAYVKAMTEFKKDPPKIEKDKTVEYKTTKYSHADLATASAKINRALSLSGLSAGWKTDQQNGNVKVTCTITHELGHSESTSLTASPDTSGSKNAIQALGSTISYLQRYTLLTLTGLAAHGQDTDGIQEVKYVNPVQLKAINKLIKEKGFDKELFSAFMGVEKLEEIPAGKYREAIIALKERKKSQREPGEEG